jgi:hypothetical protein
MSHRRTGRLSQAVVGLWIVVDSLKRSPDLAGRFLIPEEVNRVALAVKHAAAPPEQDKEKSYQPRVRLNRSLAALRREHQDLFPHVLGWLSQPEIREFFSRKGHSPTWHRWVEGIAKIQKGMRLIEALETRRKVVRGKIREIKSGRPPGMEFSIYHDAALYAEYLTQVVGVSSERATEQVMKLGRQTEGGLDRREIQRWRKRVRGIKPKIKDKDLKKRLHEQHKAMLQQQYEEIARKYVLE